jgi:hypothetical protein
MPSTLSDSPVGFFIQGMIADQSAAINSYASRFGLPATAIAGAVAQEGSTVYSQVPDPFGDEDLTVKNWRDTFLDTRVLSFTHDEIKADFEARRSEIATPRLPPPGAFIDNVKDTVNEVVTKYNSPTANDIGAGNVNLGTAILMLQRYLSNPAYADDPLQLRQYANDYNKFAADIVDPSKPTTFAVATLVLKQGDLDYTRVFGDQYTSASIRDQTAYLTTYYKQGSRYPDPMINGDTSLGVPTDGGVLVLPPASNGDGAPFVLRNFETFRSILGGTRGAVDPNVADPGSALQTQAAATDTSGFTVSFANLGLTLRENTDGTGYFETSNGTSIKFGVDANVGVGTRADGSPIILLSSAAGITGQTDTKDLFLARAGGQVAFTGDSIRVADFGQNGFIDTKTYDYVNNLRNEVLTTNTGASASQSYDPDGHVSSVTLTSSDGSTQSFTGDIGGALGSNLGALLGGNSIAARALGSTVVGALGRTLGQGLEQSGLFSQAVTERGIDGRTLMDRSTGDAIEQVGLASENGAIDGVNFGDSVGGGISSLLVGEAAQALGLHGLGGQLVTTVAGTITSKLVSNLGNLVIPAGEGLGVDSLDVLFAGFESAQFGINLVGNIGAVFGSFLGGQVVHPETQAGGIGASIGSTLGGIIGNAVVPIIGGFIGSFIGDVLGSLLGDLVGSPASSWAQVGLSDPVYGPVYGMTVQGAANGGDRNTFKPLADAVAGSANELVAMTGGRAFELVGTQAVTYDQTGALARRAQMLRDRARPYRSTAITFCAKTCSAGLSTSPRLLCLQQARFRNLRAV